MTAPWQCHGWRRGTEDCRNPHRIGFLTCGKHKHQEELAASLKAQRDAELEAVTAR